ncbi:MAG: signal peptidase II, partial [Alphaproteobacteria bacterium]
VALDQAAKWAVVEHLMRPPRVIPLTPFFNLVLTHNTGISFGLFQGGSANAWVLTGFALAVVGGLMVWLWRQPEPLIAWAIGLVIGGALGNVVDRVRLGAVVDFLDLHIGDWHWPAFNFADTAITVGVGLLLLDGLFETSRRGKKGPDNLG